MAAAAPVGMALCDRELRILQLNPQLAALIGAPETARGRRLVELAPALGTLVEPLARDVLDGAGVMAFEADAAELGVAKERRHFMLRVFPVGSRGAAVGVIVEDVTAQRAEAERAIRAREELLAVVSHDLRNPLSAVAMSAAVLERSVESDQARRAAQSIQRAIERMARLIGDLLDLSRIEAGRMPIEPKPHDGGALIGDALELVGTLAAEKSIRLEAAPPAGGLTIRCDRERILQVLSNLLGNAIKFTPASGRIVLGCDPRADVVRFFVQDNGPGIAAQAQARLFDRFWQAAPRDRAGVGLGLAIARAIVEAHDGQIGVDSEPGRGSTFWFELPR